PRFRLDLARTGYTPIEECIEERCMSKYLLALPVALSVAAFASQVSARDGAGRDAAMRRCIKVAYVQYHDQSQHLHRAEVYMACMVAAGYKPLRLLSVCNKQSRVEVVLSPTQTQSINRSS